MYAVYLSRDYFALSAQLNSLDPGDPHRGFFEGQLDAAFLRDGSAGEKLRRFLELPGMEADWRKEAWYTLGETESRHGDYEAAARDLAHVLEEPAAQLGSMERTEVEADLSAARALRDTPPQSRSDHSGASSVNVTWSTNGMDRGGWLYVDFRVNGLTENALFDTGAGCSVASESFARRHELHMLSGMTSAIGVTGHSVPARLGLADEVQIGKMTFQHVVFAVLSDKDVSFAQFGVKVDSVIGLPLILPLGHLRVSPRDYSMEIGLPLNSATAVSTQEPNLALDRLLPLVGVRYGDSNLPFILDTGLNTTNLFKRFGQRFPQALLGSVLNVFGQAFLGDNPEVSFQTLPQLELTVGNNPVLLRGIDAFTVDESANLPPVFGMMGGDLLAGGYELDFQQMRFSLPVTDPSNSAVPSPVATSP